MKPKYMKIKKSFIKNMIIFLINKRASRRDNMKSKEVMRRIIANIYWSLKRDYKHMELQDIYYDVGLAVGYCQAIDRADISHKIYDNFMEGK